LRKEERFGDVIKRKEERCGMLLRERKKGVGMRTEEKVRKEDVGRLHLLHVSRVVEVGGEGSL